MVQIPSWVRARYGIRLLPIPNRHTPFAVFTSPASGQVDDLDPVRILIRAA